MSKREELIRNHRATRYVLEQKLISATSIELENIIQWKEFKKSLLATKELEKYEKDSK